MYILASESNFIKVNFQTKVVVWNIKNEHQASTPIDGNNYLFK